MVTKRDDFYSLPAVLEWYANVGGWQHPGEEVALGMVAPLVRSKRVLDLGVGGGRTVGLLALLTDHYVGVDSSPGMVERCRARYPAKDFRVGDARDLSEFGDASFEFVFFSFNGIDTADDQDRKRIYKEIHRVLTRDGVFVFSTLNLHGRSYAESPFQLHRPGRPFDRSLRAVALLVFRNLSDPLRVPRRWRNWLLATRHRVEGDGWAICALAVRDFILLNHFVTLEHLRTELGEAGFNIMAVLGSDDYEGSPAGDETIDHSDAIYAVVQPCP